MKVAIVDQKRGSPVLLASDQSPDGLHHLVHPGVHVGVFVAFAILFGEIIPQEIFLMRKLREYDSHHGNTDQAILNEIDPFAEGAADDQKADRRLLGMRKETGEKKRFLLIGHLLFLSEDIRVREIEEGLNVLEIFVGREIKEIVPKFPRDEAGEITG